MPTVTYRCESCPARVTKPRGSCPKCKAARRKKLAARPTADQIDAAEREQRMLARGRNVPCE